MIQAFFRSDIESRDRKRPRIAATADLDHRLERCQSDRRIRGVDDVAWSPLENRVVLILAVFGGTGSSAGLEARNAAAQIPASRALAEVSSDRAHLAQRR